MSKPTKEDLLLAFVGEIGAARRRLQTIDRKWVRTARTPEELEEARCAVMLSMAMLRRLKEARELLDMVADNDASGHLYDKEER